MLQAFTIGRNQNRVECLLLPEEMWWAGRRFWPFSASCDGPLWVDCCRSRVADQGHEVRWSNPMQTPGQRYRKRVVKWNAILRQLSWLCGADCKPAYLAQNPGCRPRISVCKNTENATFCRCLKGGYSFCINELRHLAPLHGVQGVECSNHSVPTIYFNDLAQSSQVGLFHAWGLFRDIIRFSSSRSSRPARASRLLIPCSQLQSAFRVPLRSSDW